MTKTGILEGSLRKASLSRAIGGNAARLAPEGVSVVTLPATDTLPHFNQDVLDAGLPDAVVAYAAAVADVDALLVVTPEYNWSMPGTLKNAIDWLSRLSPNPLDGMPVAIWSVSPGLLACWAARGCMRGFDMFCFRRGCRSWPSRRCRSR